MANIDNKKGDLFVKKRLLLTVVCLLVVSLIGSSIGWAAPGLGKEKNFLPPGLAKKEILPPPFQHLTPKQPIEENENEKEKEKENENKEECVISGQLTGTVILVEEVAGDKWIVIKGKESLKALSLAGIDRKFVVGDVVEAEFTGDTVTAIALLTPADEVPVVINDLSYIFSVSPKKAHVNDQVTFSLNIKNDTEKDVVKELTSSQQYDFIVKKDGKKLWQWSDNYSFLTVMGTIKIAVGESVAYGASWKPEKEGSYTVEAYFIGESSTNPVAVEKFEVK